MTDPVHEAHVQRALAGMAAGSLPAAEELYDLMGRWVFALTMLITGRQPCADDATIATFVHLWRYADQRPDDASATGWILKVAATRASAEMAGTPGAQGTEGTGHEPGL